MDRWLGHVVTSWWGGCVRKKGRSKKVPFSLKNVNRSLCYTTRMVILLSGPDTFRSQRRFVQLRDAFRSKHDPSGMSMVVLDAAEADGPAVRSAVTTQGFFSSKRF